MVNNYIGKICPFCKTEFKADDEIVVCSDCDMPHHKDCWIENQGCTTFGCLGSIKSVDSTVTSVTTTELSFDDPPQPSDSTIYCTHCGSPNGNSASFCSKCGTRLTTNVREQQASVYENASQHTYQNGNNQNAYANNIAYQQTYGQYNGNGYGYAQQATIDNDVVQLIGAKSEYYVPKFQELKQQNKKTTWNWPAFWVAPYWFIYRKMYGYGYGILAVAFILSFIPVLSFFALGGYVALGLFANYIYMIELEKKANQAKSMNEPFRSQYMFKNGGTNTTATVLTIIGYAVLLGLISA